MGWPSWSDVTSAASNTFNAARDTVSNGVTAVQQTATSAYNAASATVSSGVETVRHTASTVTRAATETYQAASSAVSDFSARAQEGAADLGRAGLDAGRRTVEAVQNFDVREAAATVRDGIGDLTEAGREGITNGTNWLSERVGDGADWARAQVDGDDLGSQLFRGAVSGVESTTRFQLGVTGGIAREVVGTVGAVGQLGVTAAEMQVSQEARVEYGTAIVNGIGDAGQAVGNYASSVAQDPSRLGGDIEGAWNATTGFVGDTAERYGQAIQEGRYEEIGMDVGTVATYVVPVGGGPARGALTAAVREGGEALARGGAEALARGGATTVAREGTELAARTGAQAAEARGAAMLERISAGGGTAPLEQGAGRVADLAAASRQSGREMAVYRDAASGERRVTVGTADSVSVPAGSRIIAHTQPGAGTAALAPSGGDLAALGALGQRSSAIVDQAGGLARFGIDDAALAASPRATAGEMVTFRSPDGMSGPVTFRAPPGATAEEIAQVKAYIKGSNEALEAGALSPTGRVSTKGELRTDASLSAAQERARAAEAGAPYQGHAGHVPDTTWTGTPEPHSWLDLSPRVNMSLGGQAGGYPIGYKPTEFIFEKP